MKVIRVSNQNHVNPVAPIIEVGDEVTVIGERKSEYTNELMYQIAERPPKMVGMVLYRFWYDAKGFATLPSTTDEVETEHQHEAIIYQR